MRWKNSVTVLFLIVCALPAAWADNSDGQAAGAGEAFIRVYPHLESTLPLVDEQKELPESAWFSADKKSHQEKIDELLDEAVESLEVDALGRYRQEIKGHRQTIKENQKAIAQYRRSMMAAPDSGPLGVEQLPFYVTKKGYEQKIRSAEESNKASRQQIKELQDSFFKELTGLGLDIDKEELQVLLHTVNGEDFVDMKVAFERVKLITNRLAKLTEDSAEDVHTARRYFGMYTVLLRILDRIQKKFIDDIDSVHLPKIAEFGKAAERNIAEAESGIESGGNPVILSQNIASNRTTLRALGLYRQFLEKQRENVHELNLVLAKDLITADNTYNTVSLATEVVDLLRTGLRNFDQVMQLEAPTILGFENEELRQEIMKLTSLMQEG